VSSSRAHTPATEEAREALPVAAGPPIPLEPIDLLAGLAPGVELQAGDVVTSVAQTGKLLRSGDTTIRRLIRTRVIRPCPSDSPASGDDDLERAGVVLPRDPRKPGE
jgi:hypothetical protein